MIRYESSNPAEETLTADRPPAISEYLCDMCEKKFSSPSSLQEHRVIRPKAPTGI